jgi:hypothetical protein
MKTNEGGAKCCSGSATWWPWAVAVADADAAEKKILIAYSNMYDKLSKCPVYVIINLL